MQNLLKKPVTFEKAEFWAATAFYVFTLFALVNRLAQNSYFNIYNPYENSYEGPHYIFIRSYFIPQLCRTTVFYGTFLLLNFHIAKSLINRRNIALNIVITFLLYVVTAIILGTTDTWLKGYLFNHHTDEYVYRLVFVQEFLNGIRLFMLFGFYYIVKYVFQFSIKPYYTTPNFGQVTRECIIAIIIWAAWFFLFAHKVRLELSIISSAVVLLGIVLYWYSFYALIPQVLAKKEDFKTYIFKVAYVLLASIVPVTLIAFSALPGFVGPFMTNIFTVGINLFFTAPFIWFLYQYRHAKEEELLGLKTALGHSSANLDFLRSQINPHFLFNALNTLYGTAIQENADRTGEGIQKLGDMMRFMLQENIQEKISLSREVDYLNNYIDLQKLRTETSPDILILTEIDEQVNSLQIAPMLLIPFVENAFKHGISLRDTSHIKISLQTRGKELLFDVYNSIHSKSGNDPEKDKSGIGLENVKQRLQLLYPGRHDLVIRESAKEFFIHLSVTL